jgi:hypothetical protein
LLYSIQLQCQENLISNPSLEIWKDGKPLDWEIISNSVDFCKSDFIVIPSCSWPTGLRHKYNFPKTGHNGMSYFGNNFQEITQCKLLQTLIAGKTYELSFWVYKPNSGSELISDKLSVKFISKPYKRDTTLNKDRCDRGTLYKTINDYLILTIPDTNFFKQHNWVQTKSTFQGKR